MLGCSRVFVLMPAEFGQGDITYATRYEDRTEEDLEADNDESMDADWNIDCENIRTRACMGDIRNVKNKCALNYAYFVAPIGEAARREEAGRRVRKAIETIDMHFQTSLRED
ncbi:hypothetical protein Y032_0187g1107 [Ancylostoma ceylanicum]|uniref:Uncharacterized protein n=1 Tax=Ancylostoma ceylanicum TaxID=53326 RepID=A0A016SRP3_9BILA|nr:hypothetical protein Y032_0187g1107 [Ancylostoma ceylanicum]